MKKSLLFSVVLVLTVTLTVSGQDLQGKFSVSPFAGLGLPIGDMANNDFDEIMKDESDALYRKMGFKFGMAVDYFFTSNLGAGLDFRYAILASKDIESEEFMFPMDDKAYLTMFGVHGKYMFVPEGTVRPYSIIGAGLVMSTVKDWNFAKMLWKDVDLDIDTKPYIIFGGGVTFFVSPTISLFGEFTIDYMLSDGAKIEVDGESLTGEGLLAELYTNYYFFDAVVGLSIWFGGTE